MKTKEELNALKEEVETLNKKLHELTDEELEKIHGGAHGGYWDALCPICNYVFARGNLIPPTGVRICPECDRMITLNIVYK